MPEPTNQKLYSHVKTLANKKFKSPSGIYRSSWIVREYKKRGGKYSGSKSKSSGLKRWFKEKWVDLNRPKRNSKGKIIGYHKCGRKSIKSGGKYPLCRPSKHVTSKTPKTYKQISKSSIKHAKKIKQIYKYTKNVAFNKKSKKRQTHSHKKRSAKKRSSKKSYKKRSSKKSYEKRSAKKSAKKRSSKKSYKKRSAKKSYEKRSAKRSAKKSSKKRSGKKSSKRRSSKKSYKKRSGKKSAKKSTKRSAKRSAKRSTKRSSKRSTKKSQSGGFDKKSAKFPRRFSKSYCMKRSCNKMGFTEKASCRYYKNCYKKK